MFDIKLLEKFYTLTANDSNNPDVDEEVKKAYLMFIGDLVPVVSFNWKQYMKSYVSGLSEPTYLKNNLTVSDEAYTHWLIKRYLPGIIDEVKNNKPMGQKGRKGPHLTNTYKNEYMILFRRINEMRDPNMDHEKYETYKFYEKLFFESFFNTKGMQTKSAKALSYGTSQIEQHLVLEDLIIPGTFEPIVANMSEPQTQSKEAIDDDNTIESTNEAVLEADV
jgi:hypothetical protein